MKRILLMVFRNLFFVPYGWFKLCWYASHAERYSEEQRYQLLKYVDNRAVKGGNLVIDGHGMENIPKENGFIFFPNHQGLFDVLAIIQVCPVPFSVVAKKELTNVPFLKQVFACMKAFMIDRDDVKQSMQVIINVIKEVKAGRNYLIFAEGTRSKDGNHPQEFKGGSFKAATKSKCPIVPVALIDSYKAFDTGSVKKLTVQVHFLEPIYYDEYKDMKTTEIAAEGGQTKISVAAAASLQATFDDELIPLFEKENPGVTVEGTYASSGDLQQQIESGLDADVFFSAATSNMDTLVDENLVDKDTVVDLLKNDVVLITPKDSKLGIKGFKDITKADTIAIGDPESVPAGKYAKEILTNLGVYDEVEKKASLGASVTEVLSWVAEGSADAGIVYATDAQTENTNGDDKEVEIVATAEDSMMQTPVIYPVGTVSSSAHKDEAKAFEDFLQTDEAKAILEKAGFTINE